VLCETPTALERALTSFVEYYLLSVLPEVVAQSRASSRGASPPAAVNIVKLP